MYINDIQLRCVICMCLECNLQKELGLNSIYLETIEKQCKFYTNRACYGPCLHPCDWRGACGETLMDIE